MASGKVSSLLHLLISKLGLQQQQMRLTAEASQVKAGLTACVIHVRIVSCTVLR